MSLNGTTTQFKGVIFRRHQIDSKTSVSLKIKINYSTIFLPMWQFFTIPHKIQGLETDVQLRPKTKWNRCKLNFKTSGGRSERGYGISPRFALKYAFFTNQIQNDIDRTTQDFICELSNCSEAKFTGQRHVFSFLHVDFSKKT